MTTQDLRRDLGLGRDPAAPPAMVEDGLGELFDSSPARPVHTSAAAEVAFLSGLVSVLAAPFSLLLALSAGVAVLGLVSSVAGLARSSRAYVAGSVLASVGLVLSLAALALVGLRYAGIDTAVGDSFVPTLVDWLTSLNTLLPRP
jgi:hypothetical protein